MNSSKKYFTVIAWALVLAFPSATLLAESRGAMIVPKGDVSVNGNKVAKSSALLKGDTVRTSRDSQVTLALNGSTVLLPANSGIRYSDSSTINIGCGAAAIKTTTGLRSRVAGVTINPTSRDANYDVISSGRQLIIAARSGSLALHSGSKTVNVPAGQQATMPSSCDLLARNDAGPGPAASSSAASQGGGTMGGSAGGGTGGGITALDLAVLGVIAAVGIGAGVAGVVNNPSTSPSRP